MAHFFKPTDSIVVSSWSMGSNTEIDGSPPPKEGRAESQWIDCLVVAGSDIATAMQRRDSLLPFKEEQLTL